MCRNGYAASLSGPNCLRLSGTVPSFHLQQLAIKRENSPQASAPSRTQCCRRAESTAVSCLTGPSSARWSEPTSRRYTSRPSAVACSACPGFSWASFAAVSFRGSASLHTRMAGSLPTWTAGQVACRYGNREYPDLCLFQTLRATTMNSPMETLIPRDMAKHSRYPRHILRWCGRWRIFRSWPR
jgi:hypothetical protein